MERTEKFLKALNIAKTDIGKLQEATLDQLLGAVAGAVAGHGPVPPGRGRAIDTAPSLPSRRAADLGRACR